MNRRSVLRWLGLAPVAAPAAVAAASAPAESGATIIDRRVAGGYRIERRPDGTARIVSFRSDEHARAWGRKVSEVAAIVEERTCRSAPDDRPIFLPISALPRIG